MCVASLNLAFLNGGVRQHQGSDKVHFLNTLRECSGVCVCEKTGYEYSISRFNVLKIICEILTG